MKKALLILSLLISFTASAQDKNFALLQNGVRSFIDSVKPNSIETGKYNVYTVFVYNSDPDTASFCFEVSYLINSLDYNFKQIYQFRIDNDVILVNPGKYANNWLVNKQIEIVDSISQVTINNKLAHDGRYILHCSGYEKLVVWNNGINTVKRFCTEGCDFHNFSQLKASLEKVYPALVSRDSIKLLSPDYFALPDSK